MTGLPVDDSSYEEFPATSRFAALLWNIGGFLSLFAGFIGALLPVMPTVPFLLLASACFFRGSRRMYRWMLTNPWFGRQLADYRKGMGIPVRAKVMAIVMLWTGISISAVFFVEALWTRLLLGAIAIGVTAKIVLTRTKRI